MHVCYVMIRITQEWFELCYTPLRSHLSDLSCGATVRRDGEGDSIVCPSVRVSVRRTAAVVVGGTLRLRVRQYVCEKAGGTYSDEEGEITDIQRNMGRV
jgi:hypothetical protein